ncbi:MAG: hypothetical protein LBU23_11650, partial [Planctomycetota bacterium]|nr:hypothetical protein [Planctomycetota bacterium]
MSARPRRTRRQRHGDENKNLYSKLIISLARFSGVASGLLAYTFDVTKPLIEQREEEDRQKALRSVFFLQTGDS